MFISLLRIIQIQLNLIPIVLHSRGKFPTEWGMGILRIGSTNITMWVEIWFWKTFQNISSRQMMRARPDIQCRMSSASMENPPFWSWSFVLVWYKRNEYDYYYYYYCDFQISMYAPMYSSTPCRSRISARLVSQWELHVCMSVCLSRAGVTGIKLNAMEIFLIVAHCPRENFRRHAATSLGVCRREYKRWIEQKKKMLFSRRTCLCYAIREVHGFSRPPPPGTAWIHACTIYKWIPTTPTCWSEPSQRW